MIGPQARSCPRKPAQLTNRKAERQEPPAAPLEACIAARCRRAFRVSCATTLTRLPCVAAKRQQIDPPTYTRRW